MANGPSVIHERINFTAFLFIHQKEKKRKREEQKSLPINDASFGFPSYIVALAANGARSLAVNVYARFEALS